MGMFAGVCETDITPPLGVQMSSTDGAGRQCTTIHDPLYGRALVLDNGLERITIVSADLRGLPTQMAAETRGAVADRIGTRPEAVLLCCTGTHGSPHTSADRGDPAYLDVMRRKLIGVAVQAADSLQPAHLTYGETSAQIGVSCRLATPDGRLDRGRNYAGPAAPTVQSLCVNSANGQLLALVFSHACQAATLPQDSTAVTAEWPGAAVEALRARFRKEASDGGVREDTLPIFLQGCGADIMPVRQGHWEAVRENGMQIAEAAHAARWNAHGRQEETLSAQEATVNLEGTDTGSMAFTIAHLQLGGIHLFAFPAEMGVQYQIDFAAQCPSPVLCLALANGNIGRVATDEECRRGEIKGRASNWAAPTCTAAAESVIRSAVYNLVGANAPDHSPYALSASTRP